ncbi:MAG TPA: Gfo/Idh/MocA family oxidoreductase, partial [Tepidisphaeraceae bacterium]|nr:Gfo/Idh/MocA family oxidoreductase [Tepidisphaeraceae bacterium]
MLKIGILGFGRIGAEHASWIQQAGLAVSAVYDATPARRELARQRGFDSLEAPEALLTGHDLDAILIATPTAMHFEHAASALHAGHHVMIEKPMTLDLPTARQLVTLAEDRQRVLSVFHNRRWDLDYLTVCQAIRSGALGRVFNVESRLGQWASCVGPAAREYRPGWRNEAAFGGGGWYDWGSHFIDQLWRLMRPDRPVRVFAQMRANVWTRDCDDFARVCIDFAGGASSMVEINTTTTRPLPRWHVDGSCGSADSPFSLEFDTHRWAELTIAP